MQEKFLLIFFKAELLTTTDLLPVSVGRLGGRREADPLVAVGELDVEECHQSLLNTH